MNNIIKTIKKNENILFYGIIVVTLLLAFVVGGSSSPDRKDRINPLSDITSTRLTNEDDIEVARKAEEIYRQAGGSLKTEEQMKIIEEYLDSRSKSELDQLRSDFDKATALNLGEKKMYEALHKRDNSGPSLPIIVLGGVALGVVSLVKFDVITPKKEDDLEEHKL